MTGRVSQRKPRVRGGELVVLTSIMQPPASGQLYVAPVGPCWRWGGRVL